MVKAKNGLLSCIWEYQYLVSIIRCVVSCLWAAAVWAAYSFLEGLSLFWHFVACHIIRCAWICMSLPSRLVLSGLVCIATGMCTLCLRQWYKGVACLLSPGVPSHDDEERQVAAASLGFIAHPFLNQLSEQLDVTDDRSHQCLFLMAAGAPNRFALPYWRVISWKTLSRILLSV